jgi:hypothetical protein
MLASNAYLDQEAASWIRHYLSDRPFWTKIFDVVGTEYGIFRAREFSYLFDYLDAKVLFSSAVQGRLIFFSFTYYLLLALLLWRFVTVLQKAQLKAYPLVQYLLLVVFLLSPVVHLSGLYFRSAKMLTAFFFATAMGCSIRLFEEKPLTKGEMRRQGLLILVASLGMLFSDEQGICLTLSLIVFFAACSALDPRKRLLLLILPVVSAAAICLYASYRLWLGPYLVQSVAGVAMSPELQAQFSPSWREFCFIGDLHYGFKFVRTSLVLFLGSSRFLALLFTAASLYVLFSDSFWNQGTSILRSRRQRFLLAGLAWALLLFQYSLLVRRHPPMLDPTVVVHYYALPLNVFFFLWLTMLVAKLPLRGEPWKRAATAFIVTSFVLQLAQLPQHEQLVQTQAANALGGIPLRDCIERPDESFAEMQHRFRYWPDYHRLCRDVRQARARASAPAR